MLHVTRNIVRSVKTEKRAQLIDKMCRATAHKMLLLQSVPLWLIIGARDKRGASH